MKSHKHKYLCYGASFGLLFGASFGTIQFALGLASGFWIAIDAGIAMLASIVICLLVDCIKNLPVEKGDVL